MPPSAAGCVLGVAYGSKRGRRTGGRWWSWARPARPGAALSDQARDDLAAMFAAYDEGGLVGDTEVLPRVLGRAPTTWITCLSQSR